MSKADFITYVDEQIELLNEKINDDKHSSKDPNDDVSRGKLLVYSGLDKSIKKQTLTHQELGVIGAVNDVLQKLEMVDGKSTLLAKIDSLP